MLGFHYARAVGCEMVECDIRLSADGQLVLSHDPHVTDAKGKHWEVAKTLYSELASLDLGAGQGVPTLKELVSWALTAPCAIMADMKCEGDGVEERVAKELEPLPPILKLVPGAGAESRLSFRAADGDLPLSLSLDASDGEELLMNFDLIRLLDSIDTQAVTWQYPLLTSKTVSALKSRGFAVYAWTVDDMAIARKLIDDGVDGIISNCVDELTELE